MNQNSPHIYLIRHARPIINRKGFFTKVQAAQYIKDYNVAEVEQIIQKSEHLPMNRIQKVFCSTLPRAKATAKMLFGDEVELIEDAMFREFEN